jgi:hypothetical protein
MVTVMTCMHCATIINGTSQAVSVSSEPVQAAVAIYQSPGGTRTFEGTTPTSCKLPRNSAYDVVISMTGYREDTVHVDKSFSPVFFGNCLLGGVPGMIVDLITGAYNDLKPAEIKVTLQMAADRNGVERWYATVRGMNGLARVIEFEEM